MVVAALAFNATMSGIILALIIRQARREAGK